MKVVDILLLAIAALLVCCLTSPAVAVFSPMNQLIQFNPIGANQTNGALPTFTFCLPPYTDSRSAFDIGFNATCLDSRVIQFMMTVGSNSLERSLASKYAIIKSLNFIGQQQVIPPVLNCTEGVNCTNNATVISDGFMNNSTNSTKAINSTVVLDPVIAVATKTVVTEPVNTKFTFRLPEDVFTPLGSGKVELVDSLGEKVFVNSSSFSCLIKDYITGNSMIIPSRVRGSVENYLVVDCTVDEITRCALKNDKLFNYDMYLVAEYFFVQYEEVSNIKAEKKVEVEACLSEGVPKLFSIKVPGQTYLSIKKDEGEEFDVYMNIGKPLLYRDSEFVDYENEIEFEDKSPETAYLYNGHDDEETFYMGISGKGCVEIKMKFVKNPETVNYLLILAPTVSIIAFLLLIVIVLSVLVYLVLFTDFCMKRSMKKGLENSTEMNQQLYYKA